MKHIYLLLASIGIAISILGLSKMEFIDIDSTTYSKKKIVEPKKRVSPPKKYRPLVLKPEEGEQKSTAESFSSAFLVPTITATKSVTVQGGGNAVPGSQLNYQVTINNTGTDATGVSFNDILVNDLTLVAGSVKATPIIVDDSYNCIGHVGITVPAASGLLANDISPNNKPLQATAVDQVGTQGTVVANPDGSFTFTPNAGYSGTTTFTYTVSNGDFANTATVSIVVSNPIWFINASAAAGGNGTLANPFNSINNFNATSLDKVGDYIFMYSGTYSSTGSTLLLGQQKIIGQGAVGTSLASVAGITVPTFSNALPSINGTRPQWNSSANPVVNIQSQNEVYGVNITGSTGVTMFGNGFTSMKVRDVTLNNTNGQAISFSNGVLDNIFTSVSATGGTNGIALSNTTGSLQVTGTGSAGTGGTIQNTTGVGVLLNTAANVSLNYLNVTNSGASCYSATNLSGTCAINNSTFSLGAAALGIATSPATTAYGRRCVHILNENVTMTLNVNGSTFNGQLTTSPSDNHGIAYETTTAATTSTIGTLNIKTSTFNKFNNYALYVTSTGAAVTDVGFQSSTTDYDPANGTFVGGAIHLWSLRSAKLKFNILNNTSLKTAAGLPIDIYTNNFDAGTDFALPSGKSLEGKMTGNTMTGNSGMQVLVKGKAQGVVQISNNILSNGLLSLQAVENTLEATTETARLDATVTGNTIAENLSSYGIDVLSGASSTTNYSSVINCVKISGNNISPRDAGGLGLIRFFTNGPNAGGGPNVIWLEGTNGTAESSLVNYWNNNSNTPTGVTSTGPTRVRDAGFGGTGNKLFKIAGTCLTPTNTAPARIAVEDYVKNDFSQADSVPTVMADKITKETSIEKSDDIKIKETKKSDNLTLIAYDNSVAAPNSGETVTVNGAGSGFLLPAGKSTTIHFNATISNTPSTCSITNTASISGSNFATINSTTTTTPVVVPPPTAVTPSSGTSICMGTPVNLSATCASGTVNWYALAVPTTLLGNSASGANFSQSPTINTTYQAACLVGSCESTRVNSALITVNQNNTISLTSAVGTNAQTKCINTPITNITYATTGATGATFSGLPAGVTGAWASNVVTISGSPTTITGSPFNYTVTLTGGCGTITATGTITVSPVNTVSLTSAAGTNAQTLCINTPITNITYATTGATGATFSGLPAGVTGAWAGNVVTISGSPTTATGSPFNYTVTLTGGCGTVTATGTITVSPTNTISLTSAVGTNAQAKCINTAITNITYATTGATGATFSGLPAGVTGAWAGNVVTISGTPTTATGSPFNYTVTLTGGCGTTTANGTITVNSTPAPTSPTATPSNFTVAGTTTLTATGCNSPSTITWYDSANSSVALPNNTPTISANKTFFARCTGTNTCVSDPSTNVSVTYNPCTPLGSSPGNVNITWTGLLSTDWNNACNWNPAWVPDATNSKIVIPNTTNKPVISNAIPDIKSIEIQTSASLTINGGNTLNIRGDGGVTKGFIIAGGTVINNGTINIESATNTAIPAYIYLQATSPVLTNNGTIKINSTDEAIGVGIISSPATITNSLNGVINIVNGIGVEIALPTDAVNFNNAGTINYDGSVLAFKFLGTTNFINTGTVNINSGTGIENPSGNTIANNACGKILMTAGTYTNAGTTTNAGLIQMPNAYGFVNTGTFTNNGVLKANAVSGITNNKMVITNACPIFTLGGSNNYTVNGIFTDAGATTSAGTYTSVGNKFTANNTLPAGTQTLYAKVTDGTCTFTVPFDFNNVKPTAVSISTTNICVGSNITLSATCASGTVTWYGSAAGTSPLGTGGTFSYVPSAGTGQAFYAACEATNCVSGRTITSNFVNVNPTPAAPTVTLTSPAIVCQPATLNLTATGCAGTVTWSDNSTGTSLTISAAGTYNVSATCTVSGCTSVTSTGNNGLVINAPILANPSSDSPKCVGTTLTFNSASGMSSYAWSGPNSFTSSIQAPSISNVTSAAAGTYTLTVTNGACTATATTAVLINQSATATPTPSTQTICSASPITTIAITGTGSSYSWTRDNTTAVTGIAASGSGNISGSLTNATDAPVTVTFTITPLGNCSGTTTTATVVVNPIPTATASTPSQNVCTGASITGINFNTPPPSQPAVPDPSSDIIPTITPKPTQGIAFSSAVVGTVFNWTRDNVGTVGGNIAESGSGNISGVFTNPTSSPITVTFTVTPSYTNAGTTCTGTPITVTVTVNPLPASVALTDAGTTFCTGSSTTLAAPADPNYTYVWQRSLTGIANPNSFTAFGGTAQTQVVTTSGVYRVIVTNQYNCSASDTTAIRFQDFLFNGSLASGDAQQTGRMNRFGVLSTCASPKSYPGDFTTSGARLYDSYTITNPTNAPVCATIGIRSNCGTNSFSAAYLGSFNPASVGTNYLADPGSSFFNTGFYEATIPANGTIVVVVHEVNTGAGCGSYSVSVELPGVTVAPTASSNTPICAGNTLNLTGTGTGTYSWAGPNNFTSTLQNPSITNATTLATGTYTFNVTNASGCVISATTAVTVNANPTATASSNSPICVGNTLNLTSGTAASYSWTGPNSFSSTVQNPSILNATPVANGIYTLVATNGSCSTTSTTSVTINASPVPNPTSNSPRCVGTTLTFNSVAGMTTYAWTGPNSFISSIQAPSIINVSTASNGTYTLTVTNANGCSASATTAVTINQALPPTITPPTSLSVCSPSTLTLTASGCTGGTVVWSQGAASGTSLTLSTVGTYSISATCTVNGCTSDASSAVTGLEIKAKPNAPTITPPTSLSVCSPSTLTLTASGCAGIITWSQGAATGTSLTLSTVGTYSISATCTVNGCTSDASSAVTGLEIKAKPNAPTITPPTSLSVCSPSTLTLTASGCAGTVTWSQGAATGTSLTLSTVGTYSISATCTVNGCTSDASSAVTGLEIKAKPNAPTITPPTSLSVCSPSTLTLTASGCAGTVTWSQGAATGTSLTLSTVGTYSISATCTVNGCTSDASSAVTGLEIKAKPDAPTITPPTSLSVCSPSTLTLTASGCAGMITWSQGAATGSSLTLSTVGTYSIFATCTVNGCISDASTTVTGLEIKAKPDAQTITPPSSLSVCSPSTLTLTASGCAGIITWSQGAATGTSLTLSTVGTYSVSATCTVNGCTSDASTTITGLEIRATPIITATNTGPYTVGQTISLTGTGAVSYNWTGPNNFSSTSSTPTIPNALSVNGGIYTLSVTGVNGCNAVATTNVIVSGIDPCDPSRIVDYTYVKAGNPYQSLFPLTNGMIINQRTDQVSILVNPVCPSVTIESFEMNLQGPELNWNILQNVAPYALFDNLGLDVWGRNFTPGNYSLTVTGYAQDNKGGGVTYGPKVITFTVVGNIATINAPTLSKTAICAGSSVDVTFSTTGSFNGVNQFQVELSDSSGSFAAPVLIGTTNTTGTLNCTIPQSTVEGSKYLIRVTSTNQVVVSNPAMSLVTVHPFSYNLVSPANNLTGTSTKKAVSTINASNKVTSPANVTYQAGNSILLTPGFESGAVFKAEIQGCNN